MVSRLVFDIQVVTWGAKALLSWSCNEQVWQGRKRGVKEAGNMDLKSLACGKRIWYSPSEGCVSKLSEVSMRNPLPHAFSLRLDIF